MNSFKIQHSKFRIRWRFPSLPASQLSSFLAPKLLPSILIALLTVLYYPVFKSLVNEWYTDPNFSYGFLVPVMSGYLTWKKKEELKNSLVSPCGFGILAFIAGIFCFFLGKLGAERFLMRISFIVVLTGIVLFLYGTQHFKILLFPIFFLIFMIPIPSILMNKITFPMQLIASKLATISIQLLGIPVLL
ncbi:MAG TPA: hypothetical protein ENI41_04365, partial [Deltaproteobacteria bacterium]|nr:hypothetical protein [Deltaproteobacteria bacterium]